MTRINLINPQEQLLHQKVEKNKTAHRSLFEMKTSGLSSYFIIAIDKVKLEQANAVSVCIFSVNVIN